MSSSIKSKKDKSMFRFYQDRTIHDYKVTRIFKFRKKIYLAFLFFLVAGTNTIHAQNKNLHDIKLKNETIVRVQVCTDQIFRIRMAATNKFPETLMERYGILKTNWSPVTDNLKTEKEKCTISTKDYQLVINLQTGEMQVADSKGKIVVKRIVLTDSKASLHEELGQSLNSYFGKPKTAEAIIGSNKGPAEIKQLDEVGDTRKSSILDFALNDDDRLYGGGNTSRTGIQHRGEVLRMWATYQKTEIPMPFLMSTNGWGVFNNTTAKNYFDIGRFQKNKLLIYNTSGDVDFYIMLGNSMPEIINLYTTITGKPYLLPKWGYGLAFGGNTIENQFDLMNDAVRFRDEQIPCDIFWIEPQWMAKRYDFSTEKNWNYDKFSGEPFWEANKLPKKEHPTLFVSKLHGLGFKLALWLCIDHDMTVAEEDRIAVKEGKPGSGKENWFQHLTKFMDQGIDGFKMDPAHTLDEHPDMNYYNGYTDKEMHNLNQVLLQKQMNETFREHKGIRAFQHYCGGYSGTQHWGISTSGDNGGGKNALFDQLNLGLSGFVNTSADVLEEVPDNKAGMHFGFLLPWIQINSWYSLHHPWFMNPEEKATFRYYSQLRNQLFPYIYSAALEGSQTGMPILRAMPLAFPDDRKVDNMIYQYMFGENLLVGIFSDSIYLPKGNWTNYWTGEKVSGGKTIHCTIPVKRGGPLFIREGAIIPYQKTMQYIGERSVDTLIVKVYPEKKSTYTLWEDDGKTYDYEKGLFSKTRFECLNSTKETEFTIYACEGTYQGMFSSRTYELEINILKLPVKVLINGLENRNWKYESGILKLSLFQKDVNEKQLIKIIKENE